MRIAVTTPNGNVGRYLTRSLIRAGVRPLLLTRHPDQLADELQGHAEVACADSWNQEQVVATTRNIDAIYWVDPPSASEDPLADYARATESIVAAVRHNKITRVVFQSSVGAEKRHGAGEIDGLAATEVALDQLGIEVTHLRCGYFFTNLTLHIEAIRAGRIKTVLPLDAPMGWVSPRDIAELAATVLLNRAWHGQRVQAVHGPEDLTWAQVGDILTTELDRRVVVETVADETMYDHYRAAGMSHGMASAVLGMSTGLRDGFTPAQPRSIMSTTPTTLRSWLHDELVGTV